MCGLRHILYIIFGYFFLLPSPVPGQNFDFEKKVKNVNRFVATVGCEYCGYDCKHNR